VLQLRLPFAALLLAGAVLAQPSAPPRPIIRQFPFGSLPAAPIPPDPNEPVTGVAQPLTSQAERSNALALLDRARQPQRLHLRAMPPFELVAKFTATAGSGSLTETWMNGQKWRWSASVGKEEAVRIGGDGLHFGLPQGGAIPPTVHVLRNAIFWAADSVPAATSVRSTAIIWNGKPATCLLFSNGPEAEPVSGPRAWDEEEYCLDNASGQLQVHSYVPGTYVDYTYAAAQFHGRSLPSGITMFSGGNKVLDAQLTMNDAGSPDESLFAPTEQMRSYGPVGVAQGATRMTMYSPAGGVSGVTKPVIVHAGVDGQGNVVAEELSIASDPGLAQIALDLVKQRTFPPNGNTRQFYIEVRFVPEAQ